MHKKDLEEKVKERVLPLLEAMLSKNLGVRIPKIESDISDRLAEPHLDLYVPATFSFRDAKKKFREQFLKRELQAHFGNISRLAVVLDVDRRSLHRAVHDLKLEVPRQQGGRQREQQGADQSLQSEIDRTIRTTLDHYREIFNPQKMEQVYAEVSTLSRDIVPLIPHAEWTLREAEEEFERQFLGEALKRHQHDLRKTADSLGLRQETVYRKVKKLGLKKE